MTNGKIVIGLLWVAALLLAGWTLYQLPLTDITASLGKLTLEDYAPWVIANIAIILLLNSRWWLLGIAVQAPVNFWQLLLIKQAGQSISFITPGPQFGGEPFQLYWLWQRTKTALHKALLLLGLDRFFELWINFSILILGVVLLIASPASATANWANILAALIGLTSLLSLAAFTLLKQPQWITQRLNKVTHQWQSHRYLHSIKTHWNLLSDDLRRCLLQERKLLLSAIVLSIAGWAGLFLELQLILWMSDANTNLIGFLLLFVAMRLAMLLPLPGGVGTLEAAVFWVFHYLNLSMESALTVIALMRLRDGVVLLMGLGCIAMIKNQSEQKANTQQPPPNPARLSHHQDAQ